MAYEKPQVKLSVSACAMIEGVSKMSSSVEVSERPTVSAYEADE